MAFTPNENPLNEGAPSQNDYATIVLVFTALLLMCAQAWQVVIIERHRVRDSGLACQVPLHGAITMTYRTPTLAILMTASLFAGSAAFARQPQTQQPMQTPAQQNAMSNNSMSPSPSNDSATYNTAQGQVTINSTMGQAPSTASPPSFEQLSGGKKYITKDQANAYPPLANDFLYVAGANGQRISKAQYEHWLKDLN